MTQLESHRAVQWLKRIERRLPFDSMAACYVRACMEECLREYKQEPMTIWEKHAEIIAKGELL